MNSTTPNPGSNEAVKAGCVCPVGLAFEAANATMLPSLAGQQSDHMCAAVTNHPAKDRGGCVRLMRFAQL